MPQRPFVIRASTGAGQGVFAKRDLAAGTTIIYDRVPLSIEAASSPDQEEAAVQEAFEKLNRNDKHQFLALHEGSSPRKSKAYRIFRPNAFDDDGKPCVYGTVSRINYSCEPNAQLEDKPDQRVEIIAIKPIAKGEEVLISYNPRFIGLGRRIRQNLLQINHDFECRCSACHRTGTELEVSDLRRRLIGFLLHVLRGEDPYVQMEFYEKLGGLSRANAEAVLDTGYPKCPCRFR